MKARAAVLLALGLAVVLVVVAVIISQLPGKTTDVRAVNVPSASSRPTDSSPHSAGQEGGPAVRSPTPFALPSSSPQAARAPLVSAPLPKTASARGKVVKGFPTAVVRPVPGSTIAFSSVASGGGRLQVGLEGSSSMTPAALLDYYQGTLGSLGLRSAAAAAPQGARALTFTRGANAVTVTVSSSERSSSYSVFGVFVASS